MSEAKGYLQAVDNAAYHYFMVSMKIVELIDDNMTTEERLDAAVNWQGNSSPETIDTLNRLEEIFKVIAVTYDKTEEEIGSAVNDKLMEYAVNDMIS